MRFRFRGTEYEDPDSYTFGEMEHAERKSGMRSDDWSSVMQMRVAFYLALRRADMAAGRRAGATLTWEQLAELSVDDFDVLDDPDDDPDDEAEEPPAPEPDPTGGGDDAKTSEPARPRRSRSSARSTTSGSRSTSGSSRATSTT